MVNPAIMLPLFLSVLVLTVAVILAAHHFKKKMGSGCSITDISFFLPQSVTAILNTVPKVTQSLTRPLRSEQPSSRQSLLHDHSVPNNSRTLLTSSQRQQQRSPLHLDTTSFTSATIDRCMLLRDGEDSCKQPSAE